MTIESKESPTRSVPESPHRIPEMDALDIALDDLVKKAQTLIEGPIRDAQTDERWEGTAQGHCEAIEGFMLVTLILEAPGYRPEEFHARAFPYELEVVAPDFTLRNSLPCRVDPSSMRSYYRNGVLCVEVLKAL